MESETATVEPADIITAMVDALEGAAMPIGGPLSYTLDELKEDGDTRQAKPGSFRIEVDGSTAVQRSWGYIEHSVRFIVVAYDEVKGQRLGHSLRDCLRRQYAAIELLASDDWFHQLASWMVENPLAPRKDGDDFYTWQVSFAAMFYTPTLGRVS